MARAYRLTRFGVLAALDWEAGVLRPPVCASADLLIETTGPGPAAAAAGARRALARGAQVLMSWGSAGALGPVESGDIVLPAAVVDGRGRRYATDAVLVDALASGWRGVADIHRADLVSTEAPVTSTAAKRALARASGAIAVDMESAAIAAAAARAGVPLVIVRVVVDARHHCVPKCAIDAMDGPRTRPVRVFAGLVKSPTDASDLLALALAARRARRTLRACAARLPFALAALSRAPGTDSEYE